MFQRNPHNLRSMPQRRGFTQVLASAHSKATDQAEAAERHVNQYCGRLADIDLGARDKEPDLDDLQCSLSPRLSKLRCAQAQWRIMWCGLQGESGDRPTQAHTLTRAHSHSRTKMLEVSLTSPTNGWKLASSYRDLRRSRCFADFVAMQAAAGAKSPRKLRPASGGLGRWSVR